MNLAPTRATARFQGYAGNSRSHPRTSFISAIAPDTVRQSFLRCVCSEQFSYHAFVIDKKKLHSERFNSASFFYEFAVNIVCENAGNLVTDAKVVIDKNGNREFLRKLERSLRSKKTPGGVQIVRKVIMQDSKSNNLVQLADMTCGAVARSITSNDFSYRRLLSMRGREQRVQCWPK
jgi:Protein of unknown function (DUF3800)